MSLETRYFLTVDWCSHGQRGVFCSREGVPFSAEQPHTEDEIWGILDMFSLVMAPQSLPFTEAELSRFRRWMPLAEFSDQYGIALEALDA